MSGKTKWIIGGASDCDVVIDRDTVSSHHCQLSWVAPVFVLEDLRSTNGTFVNGQRINSPMPVTRADEVLMGSQIPMPWPDSQIAGIRDTLTIGREPDNDIVFDYDMVSGYHAQLIVEGGRTFLVDVGSTNGTALGSPDRPVKRAEISTRDTAYFGSFAVPVRDLLEQVLRRKQQLRRGVQTQDFANKSASLVKAVAPNTPTKWSAQLQDPRVVAAAAVVLSMLLALFIFTRPATVPVTASVSPESKQSQPISLLTSPEDRPVSSRPASASESKSETEKHVPQRAHTKSLNELMAQNRKAIAWVGLRVESPMGGSYLFPIATAWACSTKPKVLISTARVVSGLESKSKKETHKVVAYQEDSNEIPVVAFRLHPKYDAANPTSPASIEHDIGAFVLKFATEERCDVANLAAVDSLSPESSLSVVGYTSKVPSDRLVSDPTHDAANDKFDAATVTILRSLPVQSGSKPVYELSVGALVSQDSRLLIEGAPVFNDSGQAVGLLVPNRTTGTRLVTTSLLPALFSGD